jgi:hypothetical protein
MLVLVNVDGLLVVVVKALDTDADADGKTDLDAGTNADTVVIPTKNVMN